MWSGRCVPLLLLLLLLPADVTADRSRINIFTDITDMNPEEAKFLLKMIEEVTDEAHVTLDTVDHQLDCKDFDRHSQINHHEAYVYFKSSDFECPITPETPRPTMVLVLTTNSYRVNNKLYTDDVIMSAIHELRVYRDSHVKRIDIPEGSGDNEETGLFASHSIPNWVVLILIFGLFFITLLGCYGYGYLKEKRKHQEELARKLKSTQQRHKTENKKPEPKKTSKEDVESKKSSKSTKSRKPRKSKVTKSSDSKSSKKSQDKSKKGSTSTRKLKTTSARGARESKSNDSLAMSCSSRSTTLKESPVSVMPKFRDLSQKIQNPLTADEFLLCLNEVGDFIVSYINSPAAHEVTPQYVPGSLLSSVPARAPDNPQEFPLIMNDIKNLVVKHMTHFQHPRFHAFATNGRAFADVLTEALIAGIGAAEQEKYGLRAELEIAMVNWYGKAIGIPDPFLFSGNIIESTGGGAILDGGVDVIMNALMAARYWKLQQLVSKLSTADQPFDMFHGAEKLVVYACASHSSFERICRSSLLRCQMIDCNKENNYTLNGKLLEQQIVKDIEAGLIPTFVVCSLNSPAGWADDSESIADVCRKYNIWLHIDAGSMGVVWIDPKYRKNKGIEHAMSISVNAPRCTMYSSTPCFYWTQDRPQHRSAFGTAEHPEGSWAPRRCSMFRAIKVWMTMRIYGINGLRNQMNHLFDLTKYMGDLITKHPNIRRFGLDSDNTVCCVQYYEDGLTSEQINKYTCGLVVAINISRKLKVHMGKIGDQFFLRIVVSHERASVSEVNDSAKIFNECVANFKENKDNAEYYKPVVMSLSLPESQERRVFPVSKEALHSTVVKKITNGKEKPTSPVRGAFINMREPSLIRAALPELVLPPPAPTDPSQTSSATSPIVQPAVTTATASSTSTAGGAQLDLNTTQTSSIPTASLPPSAVPSTASPANPNS